MVEWMVFCILGVLDDSLQKEKQCKKEEEEEEEEGEKVQVCVV